MLHPNTILHRGIMKYVLSVRIYRNIKTFHCASTNDEFDSTSELVRQTTLTVHCTMFGINEQRFLKMLSSRLFLNFRKLYFKRRRGLDHNGSRPASLLRGGPVKRSKHQVDQIY
jgi:hypothetical protein